MDALGDAGLVRDDVDAVFVGSLYEPPGLGQRALKELDLTGISITNVENACATGTDAFIGAARLVASGEVGVALAVGVDTPTRIAASGALPLTSGDPLIDIGMTGPALYAMRATAYMRNYDITATDLAAVSVKSRHYAGAQPDHDIQHAGNRQRRALVADDRRPANSPAVLSGL